MTKTIFEEMGGTDVYKRQGEHGCGSHSCH